MNLKQIIFGPQQIIIYLSITWGQRMGQEMLKLLLAPRFSGDGQRQQTTTLNNKLQHSATPLTFAHPKP
jgi:hypothetical protein